MSLFYSSVFFAVITAVSATEYLVGGPVIGWRIPPKNETELYNVWASRHQFYVGDSLHFVYGFDAILVSSEFACYHCDPRQPFAFYNDGDNVIYLDKVGPICFMSAVTDNCKQGLKMVLEVFNPPPPPPPSPPPPPPAIPDPPPPAIPKPLPIPNPPARPDPPPLPPDPPRIPNPPPIPNPPARPDPPRIHNPPPIPNPPARPNPPPRMIPDPPRIPNPPPIPKPPAGPHPPARSSPPKDSGDETAQLPSPSDSADPLAVSLVVTAVIVGLGLWALKA